MTTNHIAFKTKEISATSRASIRIGDNYFTFESTETRTVDYTMLPKDLNEAEECINNEWSALWDTVNAEIDNQIIETREFLKNKR